MANIAIRIVVLAWAALASFYSGAVSIPHAYAGSMTLLGVGKAPTGGGGTSPTITPGASVNPTNIGFATATPTVTGLNGGVNYPAGALVVVGFIQDQGSITFTSPSIGGNAATQLTGAAAAGGQCTMYQAVMASSSPDTFTVTASNNLNIAGAAGAYFQNLASTTADTTAKQDISGNADPQHVSTTPVVTATGFGFSIVGELGTGTVASPPTALSWGSTTSGTGDTYGSATFGTFPYAIGSAHTATAGNWTPNTGAGGFGVSGVTNSMSFLACMSAVTYH